MRTKNVQKHDTGGTDKKETTPRVFRALAVALALAVVSVGVAGVTGTAAAQTTTAPNCGDVGYTQDVDGNFEVTNVSQLQCMGNSSTSTSLGDSFVLTQDIDATGTDQWNGGAGFDPVGEPTWDGGTPFTGMFDGSSQEITGLTINRNTGRNGLFGAVNESAVVENLAIKDIEISLTGDEFYAGGVVGYIQFRGAQIRNVTVTGSISGVDRYAGGIAGFVNGGDTLIADSSADVNVSGRAHISGFVGQLDTSFTTLSATIRDASASGNATGTGSFTGGLVGENLGRVLNSSASVDVRNTGCCDIGGIAGDNDGGLIAKSEATGDVTGTSDSLVGGVAGVNSGTVNESYATGEVDNSANSVGGVVGFNDGSVSRSYATGSVNGSDNIGGAVGYNFGGTVDESYATGSVSGNSSLSGLVGFNDGGTVTDGYWDVNTTNQSSSDGGTGLTTAEMKGDASKTNMTGFDFTNTWDVVDTSDGISYPFLRDNTQTPAPGLERLGADGGDGTGEEEDCIDRRSVSRGQEGQECPSDRGVSRGESRDELDRGAGRDGDTSRRDRSRGEGRNRGR